MVEAGQLHSPGRAGKDGSVEVHLGEDHPGFHDEAYRARRNAIAAAAVAWEPGAPVPRIAYTDVEDDVWRRGARELHARPERYACAEFLEAKQALALPEDRVPQLDEVTTGMASLTGFAYRPAPGLRAAREGARAA